MFISIIGSPLGIANIKMIPVSLMPPGKDSENERPII
jgi:uncharacterized membrane protein YccF (DUF307 family)